MTAGALSPFRCFALTGQREWDDFESTFRAGRQERLLAHGDPRARQPEDFHAGGVRGSLGAGWRLAVRPRLSVVRPARYR